MWFSGAAPHLLHIVYSEMFFLHKLVVINLTFFLPRSLAILF